jgi:hypothetical protein
LATIEVIDDMQAWEHFSRMTFSRMSEQTKTILEAISSPMTLKMPKRLFGRGARSSTMPMG